MSETAADLIATAVDPAHEAIPAVITETQAEVGALRAALERRPS